MMSSGWADEYAIMRDLAMVQGCVPVSLAGALGAGEKPPRAIQIIEETEEEFYRNCIGDSTVVGEPDLGLITRMLDVIRNDEPSSSESDSDSDKEKDDLPRTSKLDPTVPEFKPRTAEDSLISTQRNITEKKQRKIRNVAIESLLEKTSGNYINDDCSRNKVTNIHVEARKAMLAQKANGLSYKDPNNRSSISTSNKPRSTTFKGSLKNTCIALQKSSNGKPASNSRICSNSSNNDTQKAASNLVSYVKNNFIGQYINTSDDTDR